MNLAAEEIHLTTYYPAPFGAYDRIKLVPRSSFLSGDCDALEEVGVIYYDNGKEKNPAGLYVCQKFDQDKFGWVFISKSFASDARMDDDRSDKSVNASVISAQKVVCVQSNRSLGVCLNNPSADGTCACQ